MAWSWGDSFDLYAAAADAINGYWDSGAGAPTFVAGRFTGSQALNIQATTVSLTKSSGVNDAVHHLVVAFRQTAAITGTTLGVYLELFDGATAQCSVVFRSDGAILLTSGGPAGTVLATYTGAFPVTNTWYAFEIEVVINNTTGSIAVRKNGNTGNDFSLGSLNTRVSANNYANKLTVGMQAVVSAQQIDDVFWQSGAATGAWLGDIRCYARMPASDQSVTFSRVPATTGITSATNNTSTDATGTSRYSPFTATFTGAVGSIAITFNPGFTGNCKMAMFADNAGSPGTVLGSATTITNPVTGANTFTFPTPVPVVKGGHYWFGVSHDVSAIMATYSLGNTAVTTGSVAYASFPVSSPGSLNVSQAWVSSTVTLTPSLNNECVNEPQEDGATSYVYDSNPGDADFYGVGSIASTPATVIATTVRAYMQKSDAGTRTAAVQLKSGATTVASPTLVLSSSGWLWAWRTDLTDPNTGAAWTPAAVNNAQIGPVTIA